MKKSAVQSSKIAELKRYETKISVIEKQYGVDLGVSPETNLGTFLKQKGYGSLSEMLRQA